METLFGSLGIIISSIGNGVLQGVKEFSKRVIFVDVLKSKIVQKTLLDLPEETREKAREMIDEYIASTQENAL